jgi:hypothetical protein
LNKYAFINHQPKQRNTTRKQTGRLIFGTVEASAVLYSSEGVHPSIISELHTKPGHHRRQQKQLYIQDGYDLGNWKYKNQRKPTLG